MIFMCGGAECSATIARYCYIDTALKVIGIAAPSTVEKLLPGGRFQGFQVRDTSDANRVPEYFQLYEANDSGMILKAEARWDTNHPRYRMAFPQTMSNIGLIYDLDDLLPIERAPFVYEAYFDKPITVRDSFYVAATTYNNDFAFDEPTGRYELWQHYRTLYYGIVVPEGDNQPLLDRIMIKYTNPLDRSTDTNYNFFRQRYLLGWHDARMEYGSDIGDFIALFPIFDTTGLDIHGFRWVGVCDTVRTLRLLYIEDNKAYISWNASTNAGWWEVAYGEPGVDPNRAERDTSRVSMVCLDNLQPGRQYTVYVRERCKDDTRGPWGEGITVTMPESNRIVQPEQSVVDRNTHLMPNPTGGITSVISGFRISTIEVYNTAGALVESININANSGVIDASHLPSGTYILRIRTSHGDTAKKLVRQ